MPTLAALFRFTHYGRVVAFGAAFLACSCIFSTSTLDPRAQGGGSDTETLTGVLSKSDGAPAARTLVKVFSANYDPRNPDSTLFHRVLTDDAGRFAIKKLDSAAYYNVIAGNNSEHIWAYAESLQTGPDKKPLSLNLAKVYHITIQPDAYQKADSGIGYFPGTDILTRCGGELVSSIDSVPAGVRHIVVESRAGWIHDTTFAAARDTFEVIADRNGIICKGPISQ